MRNILSEISKYSGQIDVIPYNPVRRPTGSEKFPHAIM